MPEDMMGSIVNEINHWLQKQAGVKENSLMWRVAESNITRLRQLLQSLTGSQQGMSDFFKGEGGAATAGTLSQILGNTALIGTGGLLLGGSGAAPGAQFPDAGPLPETTVADRQIYPWLKPEDSGPVLPANQNQVSQNFSTTSGVPAAAGPTAPEVMAADSQISRALEQYRRRLRPRPAGANRPGRLPGGGRSSR